MWCLRSIGCTIGYTLCIHGVHMNGSGLRIRVDDALRQEFIEACRSHDQTAAQVLRAYMRDFIEQQANGRQRELFVGEQEAPGYGAEVKSSSP